MFACFFEAGRIVLIISQLRLGQTLKPPMLDRHIADDQLGNEVAGSEVELETS